jgi:hypothetical protein
MAELLNVNLRTVQKIEARDISVSINLAKVATWKTGVSREWLLGNSDCEPILDRDGGRFSKKLFEQIQKELADVSNPRMEIELSAVMLSAILMSAEKNGRGQEARELAEEFLVDLRRLYGLDLEHLVAEGGPPGIGVAGGYIAREEAGKLRPTAKSAELTLLIYEALGRWHNRRSKKSITSLAEFRKEIRDALKSVISEEILRKNQPAGPKL